MDGQQRDLLGAMQLFDHEGITSAIRQAFVVYLASHNRPIHEVLFPVKRDIVQEYKRTFRGMTVEPVALEDPLKARDRMMTELQEGLNSAVQNTELTLEATEIPPCSCSEVGSIQRHLVQFRHSQ